MTFWTQEHETLMRACRIAGLLGEGITARQLCALLALHQGGGALRFRQLVAALGCSSRGAVTRVHQALRRLGFAERRSVPDDGRDCLIALTPDGAAFLNQLVSVGRAQERAA